MYNGKTFTATEMVFFIVCAGGDEIGAALRELVDGSMGPGRRPGFAWAQGDGAVPLRQLKSGAEPPHSITCRSFKLFRCRDSVLDCGGSAPLFWNVHENEMRRKKARRFSFPLCDCALPYAKPP